MPGIWAVEAMLMRKSKLTATEENSLCFNVMGFVIFLKDARISGFISEKRVFT
jgi:hypothetical protein